MGQFVYKPAPLDDANTHVQWADEIRAKVQAAGHTISLRTVLLAWEAYSDSVCAGWIVHEKKDADELLACMEPWLFDMEEAQT